jgi:hypothetical protein
MGSYNRINGAYAGGNDPILNRVVCEAAFGCGPTAVLGLGVSPLPDIPLGAIPSYRSIIDKMAYSRRIFQVSISRV